MLQCWAQKPDDRPTFVALREFLLEVGVKYDLLFSTFMDVVFSITPHAHVRLLSKRHLIARLDVRPMFPQQSIIDFTST